MEVYLYQSTSVRAPSLLFLVHANNLPNNRKLCSDHNANVEPLRVVILGVLLRVRGVGLHVEVEGAGVRVHFQDHAETYLISTNISKNLLRKFSDIYFFYDSNLNEGR